MVNRTRVEGGGYSKHDITTLFNRQTSYYITILHTWKKIVTKVIGWIIQVVPIFIVLRPRPRTYASTSPLVPLQLHQQQQLLSINIINSTIHHLQHAKLRILLQHLTSHAAYERSGGPPKRPAAKRPCMHYDRKTAVETAVVPHYWNARYFPVGTVTSILFSDIRTKGGT